MIDVNWDLAPEGAVAVGQRKDAIAFTDEDDHVFLNGHWGISMGWKTIATRPTQTKTVADSSQTSCSESEKWTHTYDGQKVRWLGNKPDSFEEMAIQYQSGEYGLASVSALKPIKPTISESEAIGILKVNKHLSFAALLEDYDVVKD